MLRYGAPAASVLLAVMLFVTVGQSAALAGSKLDVNATREAYQRRRGWRPSSLRVSRVVDARMPDMRSFANAVARTRERVKCRDSDIILVSFPKVRRDSDNVRPPTTCSLVIRLVQVISPSLPPVLLSPRGCC
jgi:hypothetical protein